MVHWKYSYLYFKLLASFLNITGASVRSLLHLIVFDLQGGMLYVPRHKELC